MRGKQPHPKKRKVTRQLLKEIDGGEVNAGDQGEVQHDCLRLCFTLNLGQLVAHVVHDGKHQAVRGRGISDTCITLLHDLHLQDARDHVVAEVNQPATQAHVRHTLLHVDLHICSGLGKEGSEAVVLKVKMLVLGPAKQEQVSKNIRLNLR